MFNLFVIIIKEGKYQECWLYIFIFADLSTVVWNFRFMFRIRMKYMLYHTVLQHKYLHYYQGQCNVLKFSMGKWGNTIFFDKSNILLPIHGGIIIWFFREVFRHIFGNLSLRKQNIDKFGTLCQFNVWSCMTFISWTRRCKKMFVSNIFHSSKFILKYILLWWKGHLFSDSDETDYQEINSILSRLYQ